MMPYIDTPPIGSVLAFAGPKNQIPVNWLVCDGAIYDRTASIPNVNAKYETLFRAIGTAWGGGEGANLFAVPDLRGLFLRGVAEGENTDADKDRRTESRPLLTSPGNKGNTVGSKQADEVVSHTHPVNPGDAFMDNSLNSNSVEGGGDVIYSPVKISVEPVGGSETRPKNAYVYYIIRAA